MSDLLPSTGAPLVPSAQPATVISSVVIVGTYHQVVAVPAAAVQRKQVEWLVPGRVPRGMVTILAGVGGLGKSQLACHYAAQISGVTLIATAEDSPGVTVRPRLEAAEADLSRARFITTRTGDLGEGGITIPDDIDLLEQLVADVRAELVVLDPLVAHLPLKVDSHRDQSVRRALGPLFRMADAQRCAVLGILHLNKKTELAPLARLGGSIAFGNQARSVLLFDRDPDDPDGEQGRRRVLAHIKSNVSELAPSLLYEVEQVVLPANDDQPEVQTSRLTLLGESVHSGHSLLARVNEDERSAIDEATEFLAAELEDGTRRKAEELFTAARRLGITDRTLQRARKRLGARTEKAGFGRGWEWFQPASEETEHDQDDTNASGGKAVAFAPSQPTEGDKKYEDDKKPPWHLRGTFGFPLLGDEDFLEFSASRLNAGHITEREHAQNVALHRLVAA